MSEPAIPEPAPDTTAMPADPRPAGIPGHAATPAGWKQHFAEWAAEHLRPHLADATIKAADAAARADHALSVLKAVTANSRELASIVAILARDAPAGVELAPRVVAAADEAARIAGLLEAAGL